MARPDLDDLPFCIRRGLEARRSATGAAEDSATAEAPSGSTRTAASSAAAHLAELFPTAITTREDRSPSASRSPRRDGREGRARLRPNRHSARGSVDIHGPPRGPPPPQPVYYDPDAARVFSEDDGHMEPPERSPHSSDSSEIVRREDLRRREGTPRWALGSRVERREVLDRDLTSRRADDQALAATGTAPAVTAEEEEEEAFEDDPCHEEDSLDSLFGPSSDEALGFEGQTKD